MKSFKLMTSLLLGLAMSIIFSQTSQTFFVQPVNGWGLTFDRLTSCKVPDSIRTKTFVSLEFSVSGKSSQGFSQYAIPASFGNSQYGIQGDWRKYEGSHPMPDKVSISLRGESAVNIKQIYCILAYQDSSKYVWVNEPLVLTPNNFSKWHTIHVEGLRELYNMTYYIARYIIFVIFTKDSNYAGSVIYADDYVEDGVLSDGFGDELVSVPPETSSPEGFVLSQNYPNPFNPSTKIQISLPRREEIDLSIYNLLGEKVETLFSGEIDAGTHSFTFSTQGKNLPSGAYIYALRSSSFSLTRKMILVK